MTRYLLMPYPEAVLVVSVMLLNSKYSPGSNSNLADLPLHYDLILWAFLTAVFVGASVFFTAREQATDELMLYIRAVSRVGVVVFTVYILGNAIRHQYPNVFIYQMIGLYVYASAIWLASFTASINALRRSFIGAGHGDHGDDIDYEDS